MSLIDDNGVTWHPMLDAGADSWQLVDIDPMFDESGDSCKGDDSKPVEK